MTTQQQIKELEQQLVGLAQNQALLAIKKQRGTMRRIIQLGKLLIEEKLDQYPDDVLKNALRIAKYSIDQQQRKEADNVLKDTIYSANRARC